LSVIAGSALPLKEKTAINSALFLSSHFTMQTSQFYLFSLPSELLDSLRPRNLFDSEEPVQASEASDPAVPASTAASRACNVCQGVTFADVKDQRTHFRSDWHRYNVKTRLNGGKSASETDFAVLVDRAFHFLRSYPSNRKQASTNPFLDLLLRRTMTTRMMLSAPLYEGRGNWSRSRKRKSKQPSSLLYLPSHGFTRPLQHRLEFTGRSYH